MSRYREMQVFQAVVQTGSLAAAARHLELSQATVMRAVEALEVRLGSRLLLRGPRGASPSPMGEIFAESCRRIMAQIDEAERSVAGLHSHPTGQLNVALPLLMTHQVFMPIALDYLMAYPDVHLVTQAREGMPRLLEEGIEVALVVGHLPDSSGFAIPVGQVRPVVCAAPGYLERRGRPGTPEDLHAHQTIVSSSMGLAGEWRFDSGLLRLAPRLICSTPQAAIRAAVAGIGLARCLNYEVHQELNSGQLEVVLAPFAPEALPVQLLYREGRRAAARVRSFIDFAVPRLRTHPAFGA